MGIMCLLGTIAASLLPETVGVDLPETLGEAANFGKDQKFFSWIRKGDLKQQKGENAEANATGEDADVEKPLAENPE